MPFLVPAPPSVADHETDLSILQINRHEGKDHSLGGSPIYCGETQNRVRAIFLIRKAYTCLKIFFYYFNMHWVFWTALFVAKNKVYSAMTMTYKKTEYCVIVINFEGIQCEQRRFLPKLVQGPASISLYRSPESGLLLK